MSTSPGVTCSPVISWSRSATPTAKPTRSNSPGSMAPGCSAISPPMRAQPALRQPSATPATSALDVVGVERADGDVVEEEERLGALADEVVDAHGDEVDADGVEPARRLGDQRLGADAVGRRDEHRVAVAVRGEGEQAAEAADVADDLGTEGRAHVALDPLDGALAGGDVDAGALVGLPHRRLSLRARAVRAGRPAPVGLFEHPLAQPDRHVDGVLAGEAGAAEPGARRARRPTRAGRG